jgi:hypothetical protein
MHLPVKIAHTALQHTNGVKTLQIFLRNQFIKKQPFYYAYYKTEQTTEVILLKYQAAVSSTSHL